MFLVWKAGARFFHYFRFFSQFGLREFLLTDVLYATLQTLYFDDFDHLLGIVTHTINKI